MAGSLVNHETFIVDVPTVVEVALIIGAVVSTITTVPPPVVK